MRRWGVELNPRVTARRTMKPIVDMVEAGLDLMAADVRANAAAGKDAAGRSLGRHKGGPRAGKRITLRRTGALLDGLRTQRRGTQGRLQPTASHHRYVFSRFAVFEISEVTAKRLEQRAEQAIDVFLAQHQE